MPTLNDPIRIGDLDLPNRVLMAPMTRSRATEDRVPTDLMLEYYVQRASAGLIISEATCISPHSVGYERTPGIWSDEQVAGWRRITNAVLRGAHPRGMPTNLRNKALRHPDPLRDSLENHRNAPRIERTANLIPADQSPKHCSILDLRMRDPDLEPSHRLAR
jgi:hypothetical protein